MGISLIIKTKYKMKQLFLLAIFMVTFGANAQKVEPIQIGIDKVADSISVSVLSFKTTDKTCQLYYQVFDKNKKKIDDGNLSLSEQEFSQWGETNKYIEDLALSKLKLKRKVIISNPTGFKLIDNSSSHLVLRNTLLSGKN